MDLALFVAVDEVRTVDSGPMTVLVLEAARPAQNPRLD